MLLLIAFINCKKVRVCLVVILGIAFNISNT